MLTVGQKKRGGEKKKKSLRLRPKQKIGLFKVLRTTKAQTPHPQTFFMFQKIEMIKIKKFFEKDMKNRIE